MSGETVSGQSFTTGQAASGIIGQANFTANGSGSTANQFSSPRAAAYDPVNDKIYVVDFQNNRVLRFPGSAAAKAGAPAEAVFGQPNLSSVSPNQGLDDPTARTLRNPRAALVDPDGNLWVADGENHRVLRYNNAAFLQSNPAADAVLGRPDFTSSEAATTASGMDTPNGLSMDANGALWVADRYNNRILRFNGALAKSNGANADLVFGQAGFTTGLPNRDDAVAANTLYEPVGIQVDASGNLWVAEFKNNRVLRYNNAAAAVTNGVAANGVLGQADFVSNLANRNDVPNAASMDSPINVFVDPEGTLWVADFSNSRVLGYPNAAGLGNGAAASVVLGQTSLDATVYQTSRNGMGGPIHVGAGPRGSILVTDFDLNRVPSYGLVNAVPSITLRGSKRIVTSKGKVTLKGTASDTDDFVSSIRATLNKKAVKANGTTGWKLTVRPKPGRNQVKIQSVDDYGGSSGTVRVSITRK
jgi:sugar lactone lactonase YvrE